MSIDVAQSVRQAGHAIGAIYGRDTMEPEAAARQREMIVTAVLRYLAP